MIIDDSYETAGMSIYQDDDLGKPPRKIDGRQVGSMAVPKGAWYDTCEPDRAYIPMCDVTYSEMMDMISTEIARFTLLRISIWKRPQNSGSFNGALQARKKTLLRVISI